MGCLEKARDNESLTLSFRQQEYYYTLYYYDQAGNLVKTVPPEGVNPLTVSNSAGTGTVVTTRDVALYRAYELKGGSPPGKGFIWPKHTLVTTYRYNAFNEVTWQNTPDGGITEYWYDALGRCIVSKDARQDQASPKAYSYTRYDALGRIYEQGELNHGYPMTDLLARSTTTINAWFFGGEQSKHQVIQTFYDQAPPANALSTSASYLYNAGYLQNQRGRVATITYAENPRVRNYDNASHYSYDIHGNVQTLYQENRNLEGYGNSINILDYDYDLISNKINGLHYNPGKQDQFHHRYAYDADNRLLQVESSQNGRLWEKEAKYYYYKHGPLRRLELGDKQVQGLDYVYTLQGWIRGMNSNALSPDQDLGHDGQALPTNPNRRFAKDAFGYTLNYFNGDYQPKNPMTASSFSASIANVDHLYDRAFELFNGNIRMMASTIYDPSDPNKALPLLRSFLYDQLNRVIWAFGTKGIANNAWKRGELGGTYMEYFKYDLNGNILALSRNDSSRNWIGLDRMTYFYPTQNGALLNNRLDRVSDDVPDGVNRTDFKPGQQPGNYSYDPTGNLTSDRQEGILSIQWNVQGKVKSIRKTGNQSDLEFVYDASGNRLQKIEKTKTAAGVLKPASQWITTYYNRDAQGHVMGIYEYRDQRLFLKEQPIYGASRLGVLNRNQDLALADPFPNHRVLGNKLYELSNHLGNVQNHDQRPEIPNSRSRATHHLAE